MDLLDKKYTVRPLKWEKSGSRGNFLVYTANTVFGSYYVKETIDRQDWESKYKWSYVFDEYYDEGEFDCKTIMEGKKKAFNHWFDRIEVMLKEVE